MSLEDKLHKIEFEIDNGLKLKAADRLRNLINQYPDESLLWNRLAELYYESGFLDAAGRYWILTEPINDTIKKCVAIYEKSVNYSGTKILQDITYRGDRSKLSEYGRKKLIDLEVDSKENSNYIPKYNLKLNKQEKKQKRKEYRDSLSGKLIGSIIVILLVIMLVLFIIGLITVGDWVFS